MRVLIECTARTRGGAATVRRHTFVQVAEARGEAGVRVRRVGVLVLLGVGAARRTWWLAAGLPPQQRLERGRHLGRAGEADDLAAYLEVQVLHTRAALRAANDLLDSDGTGCGSGVRRFR